MDVRRAGLLAERPLHDVLVPALRRRRLIGAAVPASVPSELRAVLGTTGERLVVLARGGGALALGPTPQELVDQLAAELGAVLLVVDLDHDDDHDGHQEHDDLLASSELLEHEVTTDDHDDPAEPSPTTTGRRTVHIVHGPVPLGGGRDAELAAMLGSGIWVVPGPDVTLVVPDESGTPPLWSRDQRPVVTVCIDDGHLELDTYLAHDLHGVRRRERPVALATPGTSWWVDRAPTPLVEAAALAGLSSSDRGLVELVQTDVGALDPGDLEALAPVLVELGLDDASAATLRDVVGSLWTDDAPRRLAEGLALPEELADVLVGRAHPAVLDGAVRVEPHTWRQAVGAAVMAEPTGTSWWSRLDAVFHRRPALAAARAALWLAVSAWVVTWGLSEDGALGVAAVLGGALLAISSLGDVAVVILARRRGRDQRHEQPGG